MIGLSHICPRLALAFSALLIPTALGCAPVYADGIPVRVRGTVVSLDGSKLVVRAKDVKMSPSAWPTNLLRWPS
jgi:hypothetical protein